MATSQPLLRVFSILLALSGIITAIFVFSRQLAVPRDNLCKDPTFGTYTLSGHQIISLTEAWYPTHA